MLTRLAALARPVDAGDEQALGLAIYADDAGEHFGAQESGIEGVACLDDVSRALVLWSDLWARTKLPVARVWVDGLLGFCRWMQQDDGRFVNFILDWNGVRNIDGITSRADGASFWQARGARAMAKAALVLGDDRGARRLPARARVIRRASRWRGRARGPGPRGAGRAGQAGRHRPVVRRHRLAASRQRTARRA
ncbi:MAG TPA: hypothetical protein VLI88_03125 [Patescibacteria group bacterium]|nr:hypothetical protein [Patescibacteria group bacterium]